MIIPQFNGRLGNQLFQAGAAYEAAKQYKQEMALNVFGTLPEILQNFKKVRISHNIYRYTEPFFRYLKIDLSNYINSQQSVVNTDILLEGYFQSMKYMESTFDEFVSKLYFPENIKTSCNRIKEKIGKFVVLHARRGDYLNYPDIHPICKLDYFQKALEYFPDYTVVVCTDSQDVFNAECYGRFNYVFSNGSVMQDLYLMTIADGIIMSNSTFSWWGASMNKNDITVIAPTKWFGPKGPQDYQDIYSDKWIKI